MAVLLGSCPFLHTFYLSCQCASPFFFPQCFLSACLVSRTHVCGVHFGSPFSIFSFARLRFLLLPGLHVFCPCLPSFCFYFGVLHILFVYKDFMSVSPFRLLRPTFNAFRLIARLGYRDWSFCADQTPNYRLRT